jgi:uncharacterized protein (UPF0371 family)
VNKYQMGYKSEYSTDIIIQQLNQKNIPVYGVKLIKAYPINVAPIDFDTSAGDYQKVAVTFAFDKYLPEGPVSSTASAINELQIPGVTIPGLPGGL